MPAAAQRWTRSWCVVGGVNRTTERIDLIGEHPLEAVGDGEVRVVAPESLAALLARGMAGRDLDAPGELAQALEMRLQRHAEPDNRDAMLFRHSSPPLAFRAAGA